MILIYNYPSDIPLIFTMLLCRQVLLIKHHYQTRREETDKLEQHANNNPGDAHAQHVFLQSIMVQDPAFVIRRIESGKFAINKEVII